MVGALKNNNNESKEKPLNSASLKNKIVVSYKRPPRIRRKSKTSKEIVIAARRKYLNKELKKDSSDSESGSPEKKKINKKQYSIEIDEKADQLQVEETKEKVKGKLLHKVSINESAIVETGKVRMRGVLW